MFVYILNAQGTNLFKIGITTRTTAKRIKNLQTGNSNKIVEVYKHESDYANIIERCLHRHYAHLRQTGEWFNFDDISIEEVKTKLHTFEEVVKSIKNVKEESRY